MAAPSATVNDEIAPGLRGLEAAAGREQRQAHALQATYLAVLLLAPLAHLLPLRAADRGTLDARISAGLLLCAVALRLVMRRVAAESDWVRARRTVEETRAAAWRRVAAGSAAPDDGPVLQRIAVYPLDERWEFYRTNRIDDQIAYFTRRGRQHGEAARRWQALRAVLTVATLGAAAVTLVRPTAATPAVTGVVSALLATSEAWIQFRRSEVIARTYDDIRDELRRLRAPEPPNPAALAAVVDAVELALDRERWTWSAIMAVSVLSSPAPRSSRAGP